MAEHTTLSAVQIETLKQVAIEREKRANEPNWCARVVLPNGTQPVHLYQVTRGVAEAAILDAIYSWPIDPARVGWERIEVYLWRNIGR